MIIATGFIILTFFYQNVNADYNDSSEAEESAEDGQNRKIHNLKYIAYVELNEVKIAKRKQ